MTKRTPSVSLAAAASVATWRMKAATGRVSNVTARYCPEVSERSTAVGRWPIAAQTRMELIWFGLNSQVRVSSSMVSALR